MTTEKDIMLIKNIMNKHVGEEEKMLINKIKNSLEKDDDILPKNLKFFLLTYIHDLLNGGENLNVNYLMNIQYEENDVKFLKEMHKELKISSSIFDKIDDDIYDFLLDMKNENLIKSLNEKYRNVQF